MITQQVEISVSNTGTIYTDWSGSFTASRTYSIRSHKNFKRGNWNIAAADLVTLSCSHMSHPVNNVVRDVNQDAGRAPS